MLRPSVLSLCPVVYLCVCAGFAVGQTTQYSIGEPSAQEQLSLELINRARANPAAEAARLAALAASETSVYSDVFVFGTNLALMQAEVAAITPAQPLSFNPVLIGAAREHNANMLASNAQTHYAENSPLNYRARLDRLGYVWSEAGENIFATTLNVVEAHASFEIDWGSGPGGMHHQRGHRAAIHNPEFREAGIAYLIASGTSVGPGLLTQNFGERISRSTIKPYITGVAIYDADGDQFYDIGEGIGGVKVTVVDLSTGEAEDHYAVTSGSGAYSVPVDGGAGDYRVTFTLPGGATRSFTVSVESEIHDEFQPPWERGFNVKLDLVLEGDDYAPPKVSLPQTLPLGTTSVIDFADLAGAVEYEVLSAEISADPPVEDAAGDPAVEAAISPGYALVSTPSGHAGRLAFHLAHPNAYSGHQSVTLQRVFVPGPGAEVRFDSRLRDTGTAQIASLQVTADGGKHWQDVWFQQANFSGAVGFSQVAVDVSEFAGQPVQFRFLLYLGGGSVQYGAGAAQGWHFDDIEFSAMTELLGATSQSVPTSQFVYTATDGGDRHLQARARAGTEFLPYAEPAQFEVISNNYAAWSTRREAAAGIPAGSLANPAGDFDGDGLSQLVEYALEAMGLDPARADHALLPAAEFDGQSLRLPFVIDPARADVAVVVEASRDLENWFLPGDPGAPGGFVDRLEQTVAGGLQARAAVVPLAGNAAVYLRLRFTATK